MGLGSYWHEIIDVLRTVIPVYDQVNRVISLGKDAEYRKIGLLNRVKQGNLVLDAGSGYGNMSNEALRQCNDDLYIVMLDPIPEMLAKAKTEFYKKSVLITGVFEFLPFNDGTFDAVMCGYSFRDALMMSIAISEFHRVLRPLGKLIIVDIGKPDNAFNRIAISFYLKYIMSVLAFFTAGSIGLKFRAIYGTYKRLPRNSELKRMLSKKFTKVKFETRMSGGAVIIAASK